jgi:hypothetical protein
LRVPDVAVTVTVEVVLVPVVVDCDAPGDCTLPHPFKRASPLTARISMSTLWSRPRFRHPKQQSAIASVASGNELGDLRFEACIVEVDTVSVVVAVPPDGVSVAGEKLHDAPWGKPEQARETGASNAF